MRAVFKPIDINTYKSVSDIVFEELREAIFTKKLKPNQRLVETDLARQMGISRTPIREAIRMLENEGLVVHVPRKGAMVSGFSYEDISEIYMIRSVLEGLAVGLAAENISEKEIEELEEILNKTWGCMNNGELKELSKLFTRFNYILTRASKMPRLCALVDTMQEYIEQTRIVSFSSIERQKEAYQEHKRIIDAVKQKNKELAERLAREHIEKAREAYEKQVKL